MMVYQLVVILDQKALMLMIVKQFLKQHPKIQPVKKKMKKIKVMDYGQQLD